MGGLLDTDDPHLYKGVYGATPSDMPGEIASTSAKRLGVMWFIFRMEGYMRATREDCLMQISDEVP